MPFYVGVFGWQGSYLSPQWDCNAWAFWTKVHWCQERLYWKIGKTCLVSTFGWGLELFDNPYIKAILILGGLHIHNFGCRVSVV